MENKTISEFADTLIGSMKKAVTELEEFRVQANLGAAEAKEKYEEAKSLFNSFVNEARQQVEKGKEKTDELKTAFEQLLYVVRLNWTKRGSVIREDFNI